MQPLTLEEQETHLSMSADDRSIWHVHSDDAVMQRRLEAVGATFVRGDAFGGKHYTLRADQLTLRKGKRVLSEATKAQLADRMRALRTNTRTVQAE